MACNAVELGLRYLHSAIYQQIPEISFFGRNFWLKVQSTKGQRGIQAGGGGGGGTGAATATLLRLSVCLV